MVSLCERLVIVEHDILNYLFVKTAITAFIERFLNVKERFLVFVIALSIYKRSDGGWKFRDGRSVNFQTYVWAFILNLSAKHKNQFL